MPDYTKSNSLNFIIKLIKVSHVIYLLRKGAETRQVDEIASSAMTAVLATSKTRAGKPEPSSLFVFCKSATFGILVHLSSDCSLRISIINFRIGTHRVCFCCGFPCHPFIPVGIFPPGKPYIPLIVHIGTPQRF